MNEPHQIIDTLHLTERATLLSDKLNKYVFRVAPSANKLQIKNAVEQLFNKKVISVNTSNYVGKAKRLRTASYGRKNSWKKAIVTLKDGDKITLA